MKITDYVASHINEFPTIAEVLGVKATTQQTTPRSASTERPVVAEFNFIDKTLKMMKLNPVYRDAWTFNTTAELNKQVWRQLYNPKVVGVTFITSRYSETIESMISKAHAENMHIDIFVPVDVRKFAKNRRFTKLHTVKEFVTWNSEQQRNRLESKLSSDNILLINRYAPELKSLALGDCDDIEKMIAHMQQFIADAGYKNYLQSDFITDGLNHGTIEDTKGKREWSREHTKYYDRASALRYGEPVSTTFTDLLTMYISCKYYQSVGIEAETDGIGRHDVDSYTGGNLATASVNALTWTARHDYGIVIDFETASTLCRIHNLAIDEPAIPSREEVVVPRCACGLGLQNYMN